MQLSESKFIVYSMIHTSELSQYCILCESDIESKIKWRTILTFQKTFKVKVPSLKRKFDRSFVYANFRATM